MTKVEIVDSLREQTGLSKKEAGKIVELVFETIKEILQKGERIKISKFGNFVTREKRKRRGRNPQTGEDITITARRVITFKASPILKNSINQ